MYRNGIEIIWREKIGGRHWNGTEDISICWYTKPDQLQRNEEVTLNLQDAAWLICRSRHATIERWSIASAAVAENLFNNVVAEKREEREMGSKKVLFLEDIDFRYKVCTSFS